MGQVMARRLAVELPEGVVTMEGTKVVALWLYFLSPNFSVFSHDQYLLPGHPPSEGSSLILLEQRVEVQGPTAGYGEGTMLPTASYPFSFPSPTPPHTLPLSATPSTPPVCEKPWKPAPWDPGFVRCLRSHWGQKGPSPGTGSVWKWNGLQSNQLAPLWVSVQLTVPGG